MNIGDLFVKKRAQVSKLEIRDSMSIGQSKYLTCIENSYCTGTDDIFLWLCKFECNDTKIPLPCKFKNYSELFNIIISSKTSHI